MSEATPAAGGDRIIDDQFRPDYGDAVLPDPPPNSPWTLLVDWFQEAEGERGKAFLEPAAMSLATVDGDGLPDVRVVLLKELRPDGFIFYSDATSVKAKQLQANPQAALALYWDRQFRQVRVRGSVTRVADPVASEYFATRPRDSQLAAWASHQSDPATSRAEVIELFEATRKQFADVAQLPPPPTWAGWLVTPTEVELWAGHTSRLHDRLRYTAGADGVLLDDEKGWASTRLKP